MSIAITGIVTNGVVVPSSPLPEGASVEIRLQSDPFEDLREEFTAWEGAGAGTIEMVERMAEEMDADVKR
jgi:hypothetical protein